MFSHSSAFNSHSVAKYISFGSIAGMDANARSTIPGGFETVEPQYSNPGQCLEDQLLVVAKYSTQFEEENGRFGFIAIVDADSNIEQLCEIHLLRRWTEEELAQITPLEDDGAFFRARVAFRNDVKKLLQKNIKLKCSSAHLNS